MKIDHNLREHIRHVMLYEFHQGASAKSTVERIHAIYGPDSIKLRTAQDFFKRIKDSKVGLTFNREDLESSSFKDPQIAWFIESNPDMDLREVAETLSVDISSLTGYKSQQLDSDFNHQLSSLAPLPQNYPQGGKFNQNQRQLLPNPNTELKDASENLSFDVITPNNYNGNPNNAPYCKRPKPADFVFRLPPPVPKYRPQDSQFHPNQRPILPYEPSQHGRLRAYSTPEEKLNGKSKKRNLVLNHLLGNPPKPRKTNSVLEKLLSEPEPKQSE
jgi:hypothetical protein